MQRLRASVFAQVWNVRFPKPQVAGSIIVGSANGNKVSVKSRAAGLSIWEHL